MITAGGSVRLPGLEHLPGGKDRRVSKPAFIIIDARLSSLHAGLPHLSVYLAVCLARDACYGDGRYCALVEEAEKNGGNYCQAGGQLIHM